MQTCEALIIGGGVMGCAAAYALARQGIKTLLLEAGRIGQGSSQGRSRMIRLAYSSVEYIELCRAAYQAWRPVEDEARQVLLYTTGGLDIGLPGVASWENARRAMASANVPFDELGEAAVRERFPQYCLPAGERALYQPDAGVLHADSCIAALIEAAQRHGAVLNEESPVTAIEVTPESLTVRVGHETFQAERIVLSGGAQMERLAQMVGVNLQLTVSLEQIAYFKPRISAPFMAGRFPLFITHSADGRLGSGFPLIRDPGLKLMLEHKQPLWTGSTTGAPPVDAARLETLRQHAMRLLPDLTGEILDAATCRYTLTPDEDFVLDLHPRDPRIVLVSACSGHGFKFGALFGEAIADLALGRVPAIDLKRFRISRLVQRRETCEDFMSRDFIQQQGGEQVVT